MYAGGDSIGMKELEEQPEEVRRAQYEWKTLLNMMEQVVEKAEEYLESATKEDSWDELCQDEDGGNELNAKVEQPSTVNEASCMVCNVNEEAPEVSAVNKVNEVAPELSAANKVNADEVKFDVNAEAKVEVFGMKEVKNLEDDEEVEMRLPLSKELTQIKDWTVKVKESRNVNWNPGEVVDAKAQVAQSDDVKAMIA